MNHRHQCRCGRPIHDTGNLCPTCVAKMREQLTSIATEWPTLEAALAQPAAPGTTAKITRSPTYGTNLNEQAVTARRLCTDLVWFTTQVIREDFDEVGRTFTPPNLHGDPTQDQTPALARWVASRHLNHLSHRTAGETAEEIAADLEQAEHAMWRAIDPVRPRWVPVHVPCQEHTTTDLGERAPCPGEMRTLAGVDRLTDLVCDHDPTHIIAPGEYSREGWRTRSRPINQAGARRLINAVGT